MDRPGEGRRPYPGGAARQSAIHAPALLAAALLAVVVLPAPARAQEEPDPWLDDAFAQLEEVRKESLRGSWVVLGMGSSIALTGVLTFPVLQQSPVRYDCAAYCFAAPGILVGAHFALLAPLQRVAVDNAARRARRYLLEAEDPFYSIRKQARKNLTHGLNFGIPGVIATIVGLGLLVSPYSMERESIIGFAVGLPLLTASIPFLFEATVQFKMVGRMKQADGAGGAAPSSRQRRPFLRVVAVSPLGLVAVW